MVDQTTVDKPQWTGSANGNRQSAAAGVRDGVGDLLHDIVSLGELQAQLLAVDAKEGVQKATTPIMLLAIGAVLGLGAVPVLLLSLGEALTLWLEWERALTYLISGGVGLLIAGVVLYVASRSVAGIFNVFTRSQTELAENIRWIKYALTQGRRPPR